MAVRRGGGGGGRRSVVSSASTTQSVMENEMTIKSPSRVVVHTSPPVEESRTSTLMLHHMGVWELIVYRSSVHYLVVKKGFTFKRRMVVVVIVYSFSLIEIATTICSLLPQRFRDPF